MPHNILICCFIQHWNLSLCSNETFFLFHSVPIFRRKEKTFILFLQHNASFSDFFRSIAKFRSLLVPFKPEAGPQKRSFVAFIRICSQVFASEARPLDTYHFLPWLYSQSTAEILSSSFYNNPQNYPRTKSPKKVFSLLYNFFRCNTLTFCISFLTFLLFSFFFSTLYATSYIYFSLINSRTVSFALVIHSKSKERLKSPSVCAAVSSPQPRENLHSEERFTAQLSIR